MDEAVFGIIDVGKFVIKKILKCFHGVSVGCVNEMQNASADSKECSFRDPWGESRHAPTHAKGQVMNLPPGLRIMLTRQLIFNHSVRGGF